MRNYIIVFSVLLLAGWLFLGIFEHREHVRSELFIKHKPSFKFFFRAPLGESDRKPSDLTTASQYEENMYVTFVEQGNGQRRSISLWW
jgi:hypothetical protein